jgi:hypothetical protein
VNETAPGGTQSTSYNAESAGSGYLNLALVENAGADGWSTGLGIMNITNATISFSLVYFKVQTGAFISSTALSLPAHGYLGRYTPNDLPAGTFASAWLTSTNSRSRSDLQRAGQRHVDELQRTVARGRSAFARVHMWGAQVGFPAGSAPGCGSCSRRWR